MTAPVFVVGTGRCGSTLVSDILNRHPEVLSLSEFFTMMMDFGGRIGQTFGLSHLSGADFWDRISAPMPRANLLCREGLEPPEFLYPHREAGARFTTETGIPNLSIITLPHLTDDPDGLFDELARTVPKQSDGSLRAHYDLLFDNLRERFGARVWVERSGGSLLNLLQLLKLYPDARYVHLVRDGRSVALSMQKHTAFRIYRVGQMLTRALGYDPYETRNREGAADLPPDLAAFLPERFDREAFLAAEPSLEDMGRDWSVMVAAAAKILKQLPRDRLLTIGYEQLCAAPDETLTSLAEFIDVQASEAWLDRAAGEIRSSPARWKSLPESQLAALMTACAPGLAVVGEHVAVR